MEIEEAEAAGNAGYTVGHFLLKARLPGFFLQLKNWCGYYSPAHAPGRGRNHLPGQN